MTIQVEGHDPGAAAAMREASDTHRVIKGRRWRISDPALDETVRQHLVDELMDARRAVKAAKADDVDEVLRSARRRVHDAKVALGERGPEWWELVSPEGVDERVESFVRAIGIRLGEVDRQAALAYLRLPDPT